MEALRKRQWATRLTWLAMLLCFGAVAAALIAAVGTWRAWDYRFGLLILRYAFFAGIAGVVLAIVATFVARRARPKLALVNMIGIIVAGAFVAFVGNQVRIARSLPAIHDVTTNLDDWPRFYRLRVRDDNLAHIPDLGRADLAALPPRERWQAVHREAYPDIATIRVPWSVEETTRRARDLAAARGWQIVTFAPDDGIVEAIDTSLFFRFKDNIVVRVLPVTEGGGSIVDMRSVSQVGVSDVGVNARRVRAFLADLQRG